MIELTKYTKFAGCGAKLGPALLDKALCGLSQPEYPEILADFTNSEDAGVYRISKDTALVQTVDFFPPLVDDPFVFGQIAAANSLSDIYAMGGKPITALSIVAFPEDRLDITYLKKIMDGGLDKLKEAGTALVGGHSIMDSEIKFGFAVTGIIHPDKIHRNNTLKSGEALILTKPLGTGAVNTALRGKMVSEKALNDAIKSMTTLNKSAAEIIAAYPVSACTDVTGFGLAGHACEMLLDGSVGINLRIPQIKCFPDTMEYLSMGLIPEGTYRNREYRKGFIKNLKEVSEQTLDLIFDPQTSGGLLFSVPEKYAEEIIDALKTVNLTPSIVGNTTNDKGQITVYE